LANKKSVAAASHVSVKAVLQLQYKKEHIATECITTARKAVAWAQFGVVSYMSIKQCEKCILEISENIAFLI